MWTRRLLAMVLVVGNCLGAPLAAPARADQAQPAAASSTMPAFTPAQRGEIIDVIRTALKTDPSILRDAIAALQEDERQSQQAAARVAIGRAAPALAHTDTDPTNGAAKGDVTVVEFYDLRCPYCRRMLPVVADLLRAEPGVRLVYKDIPILGPPSVLGARAVLAAQRQDGYVRLHDAIMAGPAQITEDSLKTSAEKAGLDWDRLHRDMADPSIQTRIDANLELARQLGIEGTPAYVIGTKLLPGAVGLSELRAAVAAARAG